jgi:glucose-1-phosphate thymidylyltransferase
MRGIVLAGGSGTRLYPLTIATSKQLLPLYDKPLIYYPISTLMELGVRDILVITTKRQKNQFQELLGDGSAWGLRFSFIVQDAPNGIAQALIIAEEFRGGEPAALILGDNLFFAAEGSRLHEFGQSSGATIFLKQVEKANRFGVVEIDQNGRILSIEEKPVLPKSDYAMTGLYFFDEQASDFASKLSLSERGELEIVDLVKVYLKLDALKAVELPDDVAWYDTGEADSLMDAAKHIQQHQKITSKLIGSPEEVAYRKGWISQSQLQLLALRLSNSGYGQKLLEIARQN